MIYACLVLVCFTSMSLNSSVNSGTGYSFLAPGGVREIPQETFLLQQRFLHHQLFGNPLSQETPPPAAVSRGILIFSQQPRGFARGGRQPR